MKREVVALVVALAALGCSSSSSPPAGTEAGTGDASSNPDAPSNPDVATNPDTGAPDAMAQCDAGYACGNPCDQGNSLGVGKFCNVFADCTGTAQAHLCTAPFDPTQHFCTLVCTAPPDGGADAGGADAGGQCGENATCQCQGGQCGCYPSYCP